MFWKKEQAGDPTLQPRGMSEETPGAPLSTPSSPSKGEYKVIPSTADMDQQRSTQGSHHIHEKLSFVKSKSTPPPDLETDVSDPCSRPQKRYFTSNESSLSRARKFAVSGKAEYVGSEPVMFAFFKPNPVLIFNHLLCALYPLFPQQRPTMTAVIPDKTAAFRLKANFKDYAAGHYNIHWRVRALDDFNIPNGLHFIVYITYDSEPDVSGSMDVIMLPHKLNLLAKNQWYNLLLEEQLVILPHRGTANVQAMLCNNENISQDVYAGFEIEHVEIRPITMRAESQAGVRNNLVRRAGYPNFTFDTAKIRPTAQDKSYISSSAPVTRIVASKSSKFIATLALSQDEAQITVWDMSALKNPGMASKNISKLYKTCASVLVPFTGIGKLAIGLSISTTGDQLAIYQEPQIGDWMDGSPIDGATFPFKLYNNPLVRQQSLVVNIDTPADIVDTPAYNASEKNTSSAPREASSNGRFRNNSSNGSGTPVSPPVNQQLIEIAVEEESLSSFIGFAEFLPETRKRDWEKNDVNSSLTSGTDDNGDEADNGEDSKDKNNAPAQSSMFVTCNGLYIDVYSISPEKKWKRLHTITLSDLLPTLSRRITCKLMMESISSNTFMWLEDGGRSCTIWNLLTGSNITHISSIENARFKGPTFRGHSKMAISPHESIVALASVDGSLTTYFVNTGMAIDDRNFMDEKIEYVGFCAQDDQLFVILRHSSTYQLRALVLDTLQLKSQTCANQVPIPTIGSTILCFFNARGFWNRGIICESDGSKVNCYIAHQPASTKVVKSSPTVVKAQPQQLVSPSLLDDHIQYKLKAAVHKALLPEGEGKAYWVNRVEVIEHDMQQRTHKIIFSFVPEPWMRATTEEFAHPEDLMSAYFDISHMRFFVIGVQTLQIWNLPTYENSKCSLQFIWSQPKDELDKDFARKGSAYRSARVRDYYQDTLSTSIYLDIESGNTVAEIKMNDKQRKKVVATPGPGIVGARFAILYCFRSIHLLAAAYTFSKAESRKSGHTFTFEDHCEALVRFTREHINRLMSYNVFSPRKRGPQGDPGDRKQDNDARPDNRATVVGENTTIHGNANRRVIEDDDRPHILSDAIELAHDRNPTVAPIKPSSPRPSVVTVLTLLMDHPHLQTANHLFVEGLLNSANGDWIPRDNKTLNPIKRAIEARNGNLVEAFIDYCIKNAKKYHPAYLMPAVQCLNELSDRYPDILANMFRRASYVPAHNYRYVSSHAIIANPQYSEWAKAKLKFWNMFSSKSFKKSNNINDYMKPVFSLRSQLPFRAASLLHILNIETSMRDKREERFPVEADTSEEDKNTLQSPYSHKIYVAPFPKLSMYGPYRPWFKERQSAKSAFTNIAGQEFFDSPAMVATLEFKWHKFGFKYWLSRFSTVFLFFALVSAITGLQIHTASPPRDGRVPTEDELMARYLRPWHPVIEVTIAIGFILIGYEVMQFIDSPRKYISVPYNYMDLAAYVMPVVGCFLLLKARTMSEMNSDKFDGGPSQIWVMSFSILALYMNILFELRVVKQLGIVVNIILNITRRIVWFFLIFAVFLISFTHALLHLLHTRRYRPECVDGCTGDGHLDKYPTNFLRALSATYFFVAGQYNIIEDSFDEPDVGFHIMMVIFFFFTAILLLNILIALMNDAFTESRDQGQLAWLKQWSEVIAEVEIYLMTQGTRQNRNYFPDYIYYGASEQEAESYESKYYIANKSNLSIEGRFLIDTVSNEQIAAQKAHREVQRDVLSIGMEIERLKNTQERFTQDIGSLAELMAAYLMQTTAAVPSTAPESADVSQPMSQSSPIEQDPPGSAATPMEERELFEPPMSTGSLPPLPPPPPPSMAAPAPTTPGPPSSTPSSSMPPPPPPPPSMAAPRPPPISASRPPLTARPSSAAVVPRPGAAQPASSAPRTTVKKSHGALHRISDVAEETSSPSTYYSPIVHFDPAGQTSGTHAGPALGHGAVYYPDSRAATSPVPPPSTPYRTGDGMDHARQELLPGNSALKDRLRNKLSAVHTVDDALLRSHRRLDDYTANNPVYVMPPTSRSFGRDAGDDDDDDDNPRETENDNGDGNDDDDERGPHSKRRSLTRQQSQMYIRSLQHRAMEPLRRTQSAGLLFMDEISPQPSPPPLEEEEEGSFSREE
ncbi:hypothetical protein BGZ68_003878 [Mortierella alpina]|nr:hypothetical protein BGZ68_003878 [Mortierella alpina]